jgi:predicted SprT family Zn-dependent metalloprotease
MQNIREIIRQTCATCGVPDLSFSIHYKFNRRFTSKLGLATYYRNDKRGVLQFSLPLWERATERDKYEVVVHETCHIVARYLYPFMTRHHGWEWKHLMIKCGLEPKRCHSIDRTGLVKTVAVSCGCMTHQITTNRLTRMKKGKKYMCMKCKNTIQLVS